MARGDARVHPPPAPCPPRSRWPWPRSACWRCLPLPPPPPTSGQCPSRPRAPRALSPARVPARPRTQPFAQAGPRSSCGRISLPYLRPSLSELRLKSPFLESTKSRSLAPPGSSAGRLSDSSPSLELRLRRGSWPDTPGTPLSAPVQASVPGSHALFRSFLRTLSVPIPGSVQVHSLLTIPASFAFSLQSWDLDTWLGGGIGGSGRGGS